MKDHQQIRTYDSNAHGLCLSQVGGGGNLKMEACNGANYQKFSVSDTFFPQQAVAAYLKIESNDECLDMAWEEDNDITTYPCHYKTNQLSTTSQPQKLSRLWLLGGKASASITMVLLTMWSCIIAIQIGAISDGGWMIGAG